MKAVQPRPISSSTKKPPVAQASAPLSSTSEPPQARDGPSNSANSASKPLKTGHGGSGRVPCHRDRNRPLETARKTTTETVKAEKKEK